MPGELALDAVALLADGRTATMLVHAAGLRAGDRVLVEAAAGGVGGLLVQLATAAGAHVVAAAGGAREVEVARELGADTAVDYRQPGWAAEVGRVDVVFDGVGGEIGRAAFGTLDDGGRLLRPSCRPNDRYRSRHGRAHHQGLHEGRRQRHDRAR